MNVSNSKIENRALNALENIIDTHNTMLHEFNSLDKEMSWDGYILIYKDNERNTDKNNFDDEVRVQIKGHIDNPAKNKSGKKDYIDRQRIIYPVDLLDLEIYSKSGGVIYFQIFMSPDGKERKIFYASLYPSVLKTYIDEKEEKLAKKKIRPKNPTLSIVFTKLESNADILYKIVKQFSIERRKQGTVDVAIVKDMIMLKDMYKVKSISATVVGIDDEIGLLKRFESGDVCFYGKIAGNPYERPIECLKNFKFTIQKDMEQHISIGDTVYYEKYKIEKNSDGEIILTLSPNLRIDLGNGKFNFKLETGIKELKQDAEFLLEIKEASIFKINDLEFPYANLSIPKEFEYELKFYIDLYKSLSMIEFDFNKPLKDIDEKERRQLIDLVNIKRGLKNNLLTKKFHMYNWMIGDKYVPIIVKRHDNDEENDLYNAVYTKIIRTLTIGEGKKYFNVPLFGNIDTKVIKNLYQYDYGILKEQIDNADIDECTVCYLNNSVLKLISVFDEKKDYRALDLAQYQFDKINEIEKDKPYFIINGLQLKKRRENLTEQDIRKLREISVTSDLQISFGVNVLLEKIDKATQVFEKIDKATQDFIKECPIYVLYTLQL